MLGADGVLYNYQSAINGILQIEEQDGMEMYGNNFPY